MRPIWSFDYQKRADPTEITTFFGDFPDPAGSSVRRIGNALILGLGDGYLYFLGWHSDNRTSANDTTGDVSGLLSSLDYNGNGFKAAQGYWEAKIWLPPITTGSLLNAHSVLITTSKVTFYLDE